jgi:hypothetical protein
MYPSPDRRVGRNLDSRREPTVTLLLVISIPLMIAAVVAAVLPLTVAMRREHALHAAMAAGGTQRARGRGVRNGS